MYLYGWLNSPSSTNFRFKKIFFNHQLTFTKQKQTDFHNLHSINGVPIRNRNMSST